MVKMISVSFSIMESQLPNTFSGIKNTVQETNRHIIWQGCSVGQLKKI